MLVYNKLNVSSVDNRKWLSAEVKRENFIPCTQRISPAFFSLFHISKNIYRVLMPAEVTVERFWRCENRLINLKYRNNAHNW